MSTRKIVINGCHGGFSVSPEALALLQKAKGKITEAAEESRFLTGIGRDDPVLIDVVERLGKAANGPYARLYIVEIPSDVEWTIEDYDGAEWVAEKHRTWQ